MDIDISILQSIGLTEGEIKVYLALHQLKSSTTGQIIKLSKVHASKVYPILERLIDKGLVSFIKEGKITVYSVNAPSALIDYLDKKELAIKRQKEIVKTVIKQLQVLDNNEIKKEAGVFRGIRGFQACMEQFLNNLSTKNEIIILGVSDFENPLRRVFLNLLHTAENPLRICVNEGSKIRTDIQKGKTKIMQKEFASPSLIFVSRDMTVICVGQATTTFFIQDKEVADSFVAHVENFWQSVTRIYYGKQGAVRVLKELAEAGKKGIPNYGFGTDSNPYDKFLRAELDWFNEQEKKYKMTTRLLFMRGAEQHRNPYAQMKFLPREFISPLRIMIAGNKVFLVDFTKPWTTIIIEKKEIAQAFISHFEMLWKIAKK